MPEQCYAVQSLVTLSRLASSCLQCAAQWEECVWTAVPCCTSSTGSVAWSGTSSDCCPLMSRMLVLETVRHMPHVGRISPHLNMGPASSPSNPIQGYKMHQSSSSSSSSNSSCTTIVSTAHSASMRDGINEACMLGHQSSLSQRQHFTFCMVRSRSGRAQCSSVCRNS